MTRGERIALWIAVVVMAGGVLALAIGLVVIYLRYALGVW